MQLKNVVDPFGEVNVYAGTGGKNACRRHHPDGAAQGRRPDRHCPRRLRLHGQVVRRRGRRPRPVAHLRRTEEAAQRGQSRRPEAMRLPGPQARRRRRHHLYLLGSRAQRLADRGSRRPDRGPGRNPSLRPAEGLRHRHAVAARPSSTSSTASAPPPMGSTSSLPMANCTISTK